MHSTEISSEFKCQGQGHRGQKNETVRHFFGSGPWGRGPLHRWENQHMLSSLKKGPYYINKLY